MLNLPVVYQLCGPLAVHYPIEGPRSRDWLVPGGLSTSNSKTFTFGSFGGSPRAHWARFIVVMSSASPNMEYRLIWWPTDGGPFTEIFSQRADAPPWDNSIGINNAHPYGGVITAEWNKLVDAKRDIYVMWQIRDDGRAWKVWEARLEIFWEL